MGGDVSSLSEDIKARPLPGFFLPGERRVVHAGLPQHVSSFVKGTESRKIVWSRRSTPFGRGHEYNAAGQGRAVITKTGDAHVLY